MTKESKEISSKRKRRCSTKNSCLQTFTNKDFLLFLIKYICILSFFCISCLIFFTLVYYFYYFLLCFFLSSLIHLFFFCPSFFEAYSFSRSRQSRVAKDKSRLYPLRICRHYSGYPQSPPCVSKD